MCYAQNDSNVGSNIGNILHVTSTQVTVFVHNVVKVNQGADDILLYRLLLY